METKEILTFIIGGGGLLTGAAGAISYLLNRHDKKKEQKALEQAKHISQSVENRRAEFEGLIKTNEFTTKEYQNIITILSKAKESAEAEFRGMRERYETQFDTMLDLEREVNNLKISESRCKEDLARLQNRVNQLEQAK